MKRFIVFLALISLLFVGCSPRNENTRRTEDHETDVTILTSEYENVQLKVVSNQMGRGYMLFSVGLEDGYYEEFTWPESIYTEKSPFLHIGNFKYTDYKTKTRIYLCNTPGCLHNTAACTSYVRYSYGLMLMKNSIGTKLLYLSLGSGGQTVTSDEELGRIYSMDLDGTNRQEIYKLLPNEAFAETDMFVADENNLYACVNVTTDAISNPIKQLRKYNLETKTSEILMEFGLAEYLITAYDDKFVFSKVSFDDRCEFYEYSLIKNEKKKVYTFTNPTLVAPNQSRPSIIAGENYLFFGQVDPVETFGTLTIYNLRDGTTRTVNNLPSLAGGFSTASDFFGNIVLWRYIGTDQMSIEYFVDIENLSFSEYTLTCWQTSVRIHVGILAETDKEFLVLCDYKSATIGFVNQEGILTEYDNPAQDIYALIDKDDYYNNIPNYQYIVDYANHPV